MGEIRTAAQRQRDKIKSGMIIGRLQKCVVGEISMRPSQVLETLEKKPYWRAV
ncbi:MAG: hypothetical protein ACJAYC_001370 [Halieaceae bacterium]|jgi:hypothetical protein